MKSDSEQQSSQRSDVNGAVASGRHGSSRKKQSTPLQDPFSDPKYEDKVIPLRNFETLTASRSDPCPEDFVLEHPSRKSCSAIRSQTDYYLKATFNGDGQKEVQVEDEGGAEEEAIDFNSDADTHALSVIASSPAELHSTPQIHGQNLGTASSSQQRRNTHMPSSSYSMTTPRAAKLVTVQRVEPGYVRTSSIYEDDVNTRHSYATCNGNNNNYNYYHYNDCSNSLRRAGGTVKGRPATVGFEIKAASGELMPSNSKSSSHASADPFRFDGDRYSPFLKPSAERDISRELYREDSNLTATPGSAAVAVVNATANATATDGVPVLKHAALRAASDEHPLSQPQLDDDLINSSLSDRERQRQQDTEEDWQTVTTEQTRRPRALELTLRLDRDVGSSLADISISGASDDEFDHFVGGGNCTQPDGQFRSGQNVPPPPYGERAFGHDATTDRPISRRDHAHNPDGLHPQDHFSRQSYQKHHRRPARAAAAIRHLSSQISPDFLKTQTRSRLRQPGVRNPIRRYASLDSDLDREYPSRPHFSGTATRDDGNVDTDMDDDNDNSDDEEDQDSPAYRGNNWPVSALRLDSQEILGHGTHHDSHRTTHHTSRQFAAVASPSSSLYHHRSGLTTALPRFPFPLISLPAAAALQSQRRERGEEDHSDPGPAFAAKARSCTVSTISSNGPNTPASPARESSCCLTKPRQTYRPPDRAHALRQPPSSEIDSDRHASYFHTSLPNSTSLLSARFFRLSNFSARTRTPLAQQPRRRVPGPVSPQQQRYFYHDSLFTPSQTDLIRSAREDILFRRRHHTEDDEPQRRVFLVILALTIFFPLIGLLALWGKFDGTIAWYARGERGGLTREQRGTLKQQLLVEAVFYPALIIALSVYYSVHNS
ncbi:hypothetical protein E4U42_003418 [Claviceps africana]|uniref:Uncharacterized protein n=1 Tax=Claviceps africana TaxID=83212 RepID=A0A8K0J6R6_9HYPO|nr:hypothetical protein E4U42_003418 [Claviceps africana]